MTSKANSCFSLLRKWYFFLYHCMTSTVKPRNWNILISHLARVCHIISPAYVTLPTYVMCPQMSHQPFGWKMVVTTFRFTVRYKWSERNAPVPCTCFKIHYSFSMQKQKMIEMKSVYMLGYVYSAFIFLPSPSLFNYNMTRQPCCQHFYQFQFSFKFIWKVLNYSNPFKLIL